MRVLDPEQSKRLVRLAIASRAFRTRGLGDAVTLAALAVFALLRRRRRKAKERWLEEIGSGLP